jgi:hypothetical protein
MESLKEQRYSVKIRDILPQDYIFQPINSFIALSTLG